jgi:hypothetical protein
VQPNSSVTVYAGDGEDFGNALYWGLSAPVFENVIRDDRGIGDGAYLFDPQGDVRAWMIYPCRVGCGAPAQGRISLNVQERKDEYIAVTNTGPTPLDLEPYQLKTSPYSYSFAPGSVLNPGQTVRVHVKGDPAEDTPTEKHWGRSRDILNNGGDRVSFSTFTDVQIACTAYGSQSC